MENTETSVKFDDRRKELTQKFTSTNEIKMGEEIVGESKTERIAVFKEEGIRRIMSDLSGQLTKLEQTHKQIKNAIKENPEELSEEYLELERKLKVINDFNRYKQLKSQLETNEKDIKEVKKDIQDIKDAIGTRLKF